MTADMDGLHYSPDEPCYRIGRVHTREAKSITQCLAHRLLVIETFPRSPRMGEGGNWWAYQGATWRKKFPGCWDEWAHSGGSTLAPTPPRVIRVGHRGELAPQISKLKKKHVFLWVTTPFLRLKIVLDIGFQCWDSHPFLLLRRPISEKGGKVVNKDVRSRKENSVWEETSCVRFS